MIILFKLICFTYFTVLTSSLNTVNVNILKTKFYETQSDYNAIQLSIDNPLNFMSRLIAKLIPSDDNCIIYPDTILFDYNSYISKPSILSFTAGNVGNTKINVELSGDAAIDFNVNYVDNNSIIMVLSKNEEPPSPVPNKAVFSSDGTYIIIDFDTPTNKGGYNMNFNCEDLLLFYGNTKSICNWVNSTHIYVLNPSMINVDTYITILGHKILPLCEYIICTNNYVTQKTLYVSSPEYTDSPIISIITPSSVGGCNSIILDLLSSSGSGGRQWKSIHFLVKSTDENSANNITEFLNNNYIISPPTPIPNYLLKKGTNYTFYVHMCNFLKVCGTGYTNVEVLSATDIPVAYFIGKTTRTIETTSPLLISSVAYTAWCDGTTVSTTTNGLSYIWTISLNNTKLPLITESKDVSKFKLSPNKLINGNKYSVELKVSNKYGKETLISMPVFVILPPLRIFFNGNEKQTIQQGDIITIETTLSDSYSNINTLNYEWNCMKIKPSFGQCNIITNIIDNGIKNIIQTSNTNINDLLRVSVTVYDKQSRTATTYTDILITPKDSPIVEIISSAQNLNPINPSKPLVINSMITTNNNICNATWKINGNPILYGMSLNPPITPLNSGKNSKLSLVLAPNILIPQTNYDFSLHCNDIVSSILLYTNGPPTPGIFTVSPSSGTELETIFNFYASQWNDPELPITYMFGFKSNNGNMIIQSRSELSYGESTLPSGKETPNNGLTMVLSVFDTLDAYSSMSYMVNVAKSNPNTLLTMVNNQLNSINSDPQIIKQTLSVVSTSINFVNCSGTNCGALNREDCSTIEFTCGSCLNGFIGDYGNKNTLCIDPSTEFKNTSKTCDKSCSNHGECIMINSDSGLIVDDCKEGDINCEAICECDEPYSGIICANTITELEEKQNMRSTLISGLTTLTENEDASVDTILNWVSTLSALTQNPDEISYSSTTSIQNVIETVLDNVKSTGIQTDEISNILKICDSSTKNTIQTIQRKRRLNINENPDNINDIQKTIQLLGKYSQSVSDQMYVGQESVSNILDTFRLSTSIYGGEVLETIPLTESEVYAGVIPSSVHISPNMDETPIKVSTIMTKSKMFGEFGLDFNSNSMSLQLDGVQPNTEVIIVLQNNQPEKFITINSTYSYSHTCSDGDFSTTEIACPDTGFKFNFVCNGWVDYMNATCPSQTLLPICNILNKNSSTSNCRMISYTSMNTTCSCIMNPNDRRRLNTLDDIGATELVSMSAFISNQFAGTISTPPSFSSWEDVKKVMIILLMYGIYWTTGLGLITLCIMKRWASQNTERNEKLKVMKQVELAGKLHSPMVIRNYLTDYINSVLPDVFRSKPTFTRLYKELIKNHRYIYLLTTSGKGSDTRRILTGVQLLTTQSLLMFLMALFYDLEGPNDDGTCQYNKNDEAECLMRTSIFDHTQTYCKYNTETNNCYYNDPEFSWKSMIIIGILVVFTTCLFTTPMDYLFDILSAPTKLYKQTSHNNTTNSIINKFKNIIFNRQYTEVNQIRDLPFETETSYYIAKSSLNVAKNLISQNLENCSISMIKLKEQTNDENYFDENMDEENNIETANKPTDDEPQNDLFKLMNDINLQRRLLDINQLNEFDDEWGIDPTGNFTKKTIFTYKYCSYNVMDTENIICNEIINVKQESEMKLEKFKNLNEKDIGLEMMHTFMLDLLGRKSRAATIFISKTDEDFRYSNVVSAKMKGFAWLSIIFMNLFFMYYSMMRGMIRGKTWQYSYLYGCIAQFLFEIFIAETFEVLWVHFFIPNLVAKDVKNVWEIIMNTVEKITNIQSNATEYIINSPEYLFVSNKLAVAYPDLPVSNIILSYYNYLPGQSGNLWHIDRMSLMGLNENHTWLRFLSFTTINTILTFCGASPFVIQRMLIRITTPIITVGTVYIGTYLLSEPIVMALMGLLFFAGITKCCRSSKKIISHISQNPMEKV